MISFIKKYTTTALLSLLAFCSSAQNSNIDSLLTVLKSSEDTTRVNILNEIVFEYWDYDLDKGYQYAQQAFELSRSENYRKGITASLTNIGLYYFLKGEYRQALINYKNAIDAIGTDIYPQYPSYTFSRIANIYRNQSKFDSATYYYRKAIETSIKENLSLASAYRHLGATQRLMENYDSARFYLNESFKIKEKFSDSEYLAIAYLEFSKLFIEENLLDSANLYLEKARATEAYKLTPGIQILHALYSGEVALNRGSYSTAIESIKGSLNLFNEFEFEDLRIRSLVLLGSIYSEIGEYDGALENLLKAENLNRSVGNRYMDARINYVLGYVYYYQKNIAKAEEVAKKAEAIFGDLSLNRAKAKSYNLLGLIYLYTKDYDKSEAYFERALAIYQDLQYKKGIASILYNKSYIYLEQGQTERVLDIQIEALELEKEIGNIPGMIISYNAIGRILTLLKRYEEAEKYLLLSDKLLTENPSPSYEEKKNLFLSNLYYEKGNYRQAYTYLKQSKENSDSLYSYNSLERSSQLNAINDLKKKELEIESLDNERKSNNLELQLKENQLKQQQIVSAIIGIALVFFLFFSYFLLKTIRKLRNTQLELIKAEKRASLGILVAGLGHEINNPLNFIKGGVEGLRLSQKNWSDDEKKLLDGIDVGVSRTSEILKLLNQFQRENSGHVERFDILSSIEECLKELSVEKPENIQVELKAPNNDTFISGYENDLRQMFYELISNGIEAIENEGKVTISVSSSNDTCIVQIEDNGVGIESEDKNVLENPFFTTKTDNSRKGFGLYLVDYIVNDHQGTISFKSKKGKGTSVTVTLPKSQKR